jgi:hypothetical protein
LTTPEAEEQNKTAPLDLTAHQPPPSTPTAPPPAEVPPAVPEASPPPVITEPQVVAEPPAVVTVRPVAPGEREVVYVPLAVNIGDGFKFGCGFFLATVVALLVGFVLLAALFVLTGLFGLNLPLTR